MKFGILRWHSLKTRVTIFTLAIFLIGIWSLTFYSSYTLKNDMEHALGEQQFSTVSILASGINTELGDRLKALEIVAARITPAILGNAASMQTFLEDQPALVGMFSGGLWVARLDGTAIAIVPDSAGQIGVNYSDRAWVVEVYKGKSIIGIPIMGKKLKAPIIPIAAPIRDTKGNVIGLLTGSINLSIPNFLDKITDNRYGNTGGYLLVSRQSRTIVFATDKKRIMQVLIGPDINPLIDRYIQGYEGSGVIVNPVGVEVLSSAKGIPAAGWYMVAMIPTREAFAPVRAMQKRVLLATIFLTLLAGGLTWWVLNRQLAPILTTMETLAAVSNTDQPPQPLPITRQDEIGELIGGFNRLLETLAKREEALKESEENYRRSLDNSPLGVRIITEEDETIYANRAVLDIYGFDSIEDWLTTPRQKRYTPESYAEYQIRKEKRRRDGDSPSEYEMSIVRTDGEVRHLQVFRRGIVWNDEKHFQVIYHDITERKRAEQEVVLLAKIGRIIGSTLEIDKVYEGFADEVKKLIPFDRLAVNLHNLHEGNVRVAYIFGEEISGRRKGDLFPLKGSVSEFLIKTRAGLLNDPKNGEVMPLPFPTQHASGQAGLRSLVRVPLIYRDEIIGSLHFGSKTPDAYTDRDLYLAERIGGQIAGAIGSAQLFNNLSQAEKSLREKEKAAKRMAQESNLIAEIGRIISSTLNIEEVYERFAKKVSEAIPFDRIAVNTVNMKDYTSTTRYVRDDGIGGTPIGEARSLAGTRTEQVVRTKSSLLINSKSREDMVRKFPGISSPHLRAQSAMIIPLISQDEVIGVLTVHSVQIDAYSQHDLFFAEKVGSQIAGAIANAQLLLERNLAEEKRQGMEERLHRSEKMEALGQLAGGVAHDLNNVLGVSTIYSELLQEKLPEGNPLRSYADKILSSSGKAAAIIQDLLTLARRGVTVSDVTNLNTVVADFLKTPVFEKIQAFHPNVTFRTECDGELMNIKGSPVHMEKTVMNLVTNAAEAIHGKGEVIIRTRNRYLDMPIRGYDELKEGDYAVLTVSDTGMGIPAENREKIFEPFYTKKTMGRSGTGLGLAIVWGTVKDHHGYIDLQTKVGEGTTFTLYFPVTREDLIAQQQKVPIERYMGNGESVLVVDDIAEQRDTAANLLTRLGYQVHAVSGGEKAVEYLKGNKADILVLDMIMAPGIDGLETYRRVLEINPTQRAILVSGFSETDRVRETQKLGAGAYVRKPYIMEKIGVAIRDELNRIMGRP